MALHFTEVQKSVVLKVHMEEIPDLALAKIIREEQPQVFLREAIYFAKLLKEVHRVGVIRGKAVKSA